MFCIILRMNVGRNYSVGIATSYGFDGPCFESWWGRIFPHPPRPDLVTPGTPMYLKPTYSKEQSGRSVVLTTHPHLAPRLKKNGAIPLLSFCVFMECYRVNITFTLYLRMSRCSYHKQHQTFALSTEMSQYVS
jgi:hypothetical protein